MIPSTHAKISPGSTINSNTIPVPSREYIAIMCEYICKRATPDSKMRPNPASKPVKKHEDMFIFWT